MLKNAFIDRSTPPADADISAVLGPSRAVWDELLAELAREHGADVQEWKCHSPKWGWALRVLRKKRTVVWLSPAQGCFEVLFILGDRAMQAARAAKLPGSIVQILETAPKYPEGTGVRLVVKSPRSLSGLKKLAAIKTAN